AQLLASDRPPSRNKYSKSTLDDTAADYVEGEVLVKLRKGMSGEKVRATFDRHGISASDYELIAEPLTWYLVDFDEEQTDIKDVIRDFLSDDEILNAEANYYRSESFEPYDNLSEVQWAIWPRDEAFGKPGSIELTKAWDWPSGTNGVTIAVVDSGINSEHEDLQNRVVGGYNFRDNNSDTTDVTGHGTMVSGVIAAETDNHLGIAGAAGTCPNVKIMPLRIKDSAGQSTSKLSTRAIMYAAQHDAKIINMSYGGTDWAGAEQDAINSAYQNGCILVAASGNQDLPDDPVDIVQYPAAYDNVIAVGATGRDGRRWVDSCYGENLDIMAPGVDIWTTTSDGLYWYVSGTSFAAPFVSGVAALILASRSDLSPSIVTQCLTTTTYSLPGYTVGEYGAGLLDAYGAIRKALPPDIQVEVSKMVFSRGLHQRI
ncbi:MAG: S8 family serine peptidase, partial [Actinomycetia bacterium]|nr:S8 family serine peptidase [Actinomycetes bacterium]